MSEQAGGANAGRRVERIVPPIDLHMVAEALAAAREQILADWLEATAQQSFHAGRRTSAVADHIPRLFDAVVALLERSSTGAVPPMEDPDLLAAARNHAGARFEQGLQPADIVTEFRLLRQEIGRALWTELRNTVPTAEVAAAELVVQDALDGAITLALHALTTHIEEVREDFLATTLHDTRQPLSSIKGYLQLMARNLQRPAYERDHVLDHLRRATAEVDRMSEMLDTLAEASRLALGRLTLNIVSVDLNQLVVAIVERLPPSSAKRIRLNVSSGLATGDWDPVMLDRVIVNLLSNALKYSPENSPVDVETSTQPDSVRLLVRDYGIGLDPEDLAWIFRRYGRGRGAKQSGIQGLGLGLYLSRGIVDAHGGRLWAESAGLGQGTTMHLLLPWSVPAVPEQHLAPR